MLGIFITNLPADQTQVTFLVFFGTVVLVNREL